MSAFPDHARAHSAMSAAVPAGYASVPATGYGAVPVRPAAPRTPGVGVADLVRALRRRSWTVLGSVAAGAALAGGYLAYKVPVYEAQASVRVDERVTPTPEVIKTLRGSGDEVSTEVDVLHSRSIAAAVVNELGLRLHVSSPRGVPRGRVITAAHVLPSFDTATYTMSRRADGTFLVSRAAAPAESAVVPVGRTTTVGPLTLLLAPAAIDYATLKLRVAGEEATVAQLRDAVQIGRSGAKANLVVLKYRDADPVLARDVLNFWTDTYVRQRNASQKTEARSTASFLRGQLDTVTAELSAAESRLRSYRERERVVDPETEATTDVTHLASMRADREGIESERLALSTLLADVRSSASPSRTSEAPSPYRRLVGFPTLFRNQATAELLRSLAQVEDQRTELRSRRSMRDPDMQLLVARQDALEQQLQSVAETYLQGLTAQVTAADASLAHYGARLQAVPRHEAELAQLRRKPRVLDELVTMLQTRLKEAQIAQAVEDPSVRVIDAAVLPRKAAAPIRPLVLGFGLFAGLCCGMAVAFGREYFDNGVRTADDVSAVTGAPVVGVVPLLPTRDASAHVPAGTRLLGRRAGAGGSAAQQATPLALGGNAELVADAVYERIYINAAYARAEGPPRTLVITSPLPGDGKTTTAAMLARTLARSGRRVLLIDADMRRGALGALLGIAPGPGLSEVLSGVYDFDAAIQTVNVAAGRPLAVLRAGVSHARSGALMTPERVTSLVAAAAERFDVVVIDTPPLNIVADAAVFGAHADGVLVVTRAGKTSPAELAYTVGQLERVRASLLGVVLNGFDAKHDAAYGSAYYQLAGAYESYFAAPAGIA